MCKKDSKLKVLKTLKEEYGVKPSEVYKIVCNYFKLFDILFGKKPETPFDLVEDVVRHSVISMAREWNKKYVVVSVDGGKTKTQCGNCGKGLRSNDVFCPYCGTEAVREQE